MGRSRASRRPVPGLVLAVVVVLAVVLVVLLVLGVVLVLVMLSAVLALVLGLEGRPGAAWVARLVRAVGPVRAVRAASQVWAARARRVQGLAGRPARSPDLRADRPCPLAGKVRISRRPISARRRLGSTGASAHATRRRRALRRSLELPA
jgi:hypothetical protein